MSLRSLRRFNCADVAPRSASGHLLREAQIIIESWRRHYNTIRPHASLGYKPPAPEVFVPAFAAWPAALRRAAPPATLAKRPTFAMSALRAKADNICSFRAFPLLTHSCHSAVYSAVMHNAVLPVRLW
jgi:Integrase core domain